MSIARKAAVAFSALMAILGFSFITAPTASAAGYGCSGNLVGTWDVKTSGGTIYGYYYVYYDSATGYNCAVTVKNAAGGAGHSDTTEAQINRCSQTSPGSTCTVPGPGPDDIGLYSSYAGPVKVYSPKNCITGFGLIYNNGVRADTSSTLGAKAVLC